MSLEISAISGNSRRELEEFLDVPRTIYPAACPYVPPLRFQERALLTPGRHPFWESASRRLYLARRGGRPVGRIAAIVDGKHNSYANELCGAFGFFECQEDEEAAHGLLNAARKWLESMGMEFMRGPLNPSSNYTCGMLVDGFAEPPALMMPWNHPYYPRFMESWHMRKEQDLFAYRIRRDNLRLEPRLEEEIRRLRAEGRFTCRSSGRATMEEDIRTMLGLYRESWAENWNFSPLSAGEAESLVRELKGIVDPDLFVLFFHNGQPAAGMVALPDVNPLLKRLDGRIGPLAPWHWLRTRKTVKSGCRIMLFGILRQYRLFGLPLLLLNHMLEQAQRRPELRWVEGSWVLEDNAAVCDLIEDFSGEITKRYRIYRRTINPEIRQ